jgi:CRP-like cAMP-binding protein
MSPPGVKLAEPEMSAPAAALISPAALQANRLLAVMPQAALDRLLPDMTLVSLHAGGVLYDQDTDLTHLYFPVDTIVTLLLKLEGRHATKVAVVGYEGVVGVSAFLGGSPPPGRAEVLRPGHALKIPAASLKAEFDRMGPVMHLLLRYTQSLVTQMAQTAVCNRHHVVEQQICSWLLTCMDRMQGRELAVTQEVIAGMLGVRREGVTGGARALREAGLFAYSRGRISALDREGLQARACECYQVVKRETDRLLPDRPAL